MIRTSPWISALRRLRQWQCGPGRRALSGDDGAEEPPPTRRRVGDLEAGRPPALLAHGVEILQALVTTASSAGRPRG